MVIIISKFFTADTASQKCVTVESSELTTGCLTGNNIHTL